MSELWRQAIKEYNEGKDIWCIPRKGSKAYKEVMEIYEGMKQLGPVIDLSKPTTNKIRINDIMHPKKAKKGRKKE